METQESIHEFATSWVLKKEKTVSDVFELLTESLTKKSSTDSEFITIVTLEASGKIDVEPIDRDAQKNEFYPFEVSTHS